MLHPKQMKNNRNEIVVVEKKPKMQSPAASASIITYSPSKFIARAPTTYTKHIQTHAHTHPNANTNITRAAALPTTATTTTTANKIAANYYVVKAGQLGSAAAILSSPPKAATTTASASSINASAPLPTESSSTISAPSETSMEHSYMREPPRPDNTVNNGLAPARTILVQQAPQCPTCHTYPMHDECSDGQHASPVPAYDEIAAKELMNECARIAKYVRNNNSDQQDWQACINRIGWTYMQTTLFDKVATILDHDQLARLANDKRQGEALHRRVSVDKSASRMRRALASIAWEPRTTQWLHALLMEHLSPSYMASYLDIMQTLKSKLPTLVDKMLFSRPLNNSQELLAPVMKKRWQPEILTKSRHLAHNAILVAVPNMPTSGPVPQRMQNWYQALASITQVVQITLPNTNDRIGRQNLDQVAETIVSLTRVRIHELRTEDPNRGVILIGFNAGAALALQVAMSESVACVICMGFAYNTMRGPRGAPDDRLLDIKTPILFVIGQNSARSSQEEMEGLRERMQSESSLVVVGSADDSLRVPKSKRRIEGVTQGMVDSMVVDEVYEFVNKTLSNPPGPRMPTSLLGSNSYQRQNKQQQHVMADGNMKKVQLGAARKRKADGPDEGGVLSAKIDVPHIGRPRTRPLPAASAKASVADRHSLSNEEMNMAIESILDETLEFDDSQPTAAAAPVAKPTPSVVKQTPTPVSLSSGTKIKMIPSSQFVQLKTLPTQSKLVNYTITKGNNSPTVTAAAGSSSIGSIVKTMSTPTGQQVYALKTATGQTTQFLAANPSSSQQKYTVIKNASGLTMLQSKIVPATSSVIGNNVDLSSIIDMPIVFADNDGNISAQKQQQQKQQQLQQQTDQQIKVPASPLIISQKIIKEASNPMKPTTGVVTNSKGIVINKGIHQLFSTTQSGVVGGGNKVVYLNRSTMKPITTATTTTGTTATSARLPTGATALPIRILSNNPKTTVSASGTPTTGSQVLLDPAKINLQTLKTTAGTPVLNTTAAGGLRVGNKTYSQFQLINNPGDGKQVRNIYLKSATGLKPVQMMTNRSQVIPAMAPGGAAVRRVLNIGAVSKSTTVTVNTQPIIKATTSATGTIGGTPAKSKDHD